MLLRHKKSNAAEGSTAVPASRTGQRDWELLRKKPLSLAPTGLAVGLALKEMRYAGTPGDSPRGAVRPQWVPRSPDAKAPMGFGGYV